MIPIEDFARRARRALSRVRMPVTSLHAALAWEYRLRNAGLWELARVLYYQPLFEALCDHVGEGFHLEVGPASTMPAVINVRLRFGGSVRVHAQTTFTGARRSPVKPLIDVGDHSYIGHAVNLCAGTEVRIGRYVLIGGECLLSGDPGHPIDAVARMTEPAPAESLSPVVLEDHVWLGRGATILGPVTVGEGAIIGARAVVTHDVPAYSLVVGNPGRVVKSLGRSGSMDARRNELLMTERHPGATL